MADVKISALPPATTPLAGTEVLPIVQSSTTKKVSIADVTAGRAVSASSVTATSVQATNYKANDGTAAMSIANSTGVITVSTELNVDNLNLSGNTISSTDTNGNIVLAPNGTGDVQVDADTLRVGDSGATATITSNGAGDLVINTNSGTNAGSITLANGANGNITIAPNGTGSVSVPKLIWSNGTSTRVPYLTTSGLFTDSANLTFNGTTLTANTIGAFTLSGTIAGGGNQINNVIIGSSTPLAGSFTTLGASGAVTFTANTASTSTTTGTAVITGGLGVSGRINAANFDGIVGANTAAAGSFTTLSASGVATFSAGTVSAPAITTTGDTNTGIFFPAADTIAFAEGGAEAMRLDSSGNFLVGTTTSSGKITSTSTSGNVAIAIVDTSITAAGTETNYLSFFGTAANGTLFTTALARIGAVSMFGTEQRGSLVFHTTPQNGSPTERMKIWDDGSIQAAGVYSYTVGATNRDVYVDNSGYLGYVSSLRESKTEIENLTDTSWVYNLNLVSFKYRKKDETGAYTNETDGGIQYGMIAEDVEQVRPDLCFYDEIDGRQKLRGIQYSKLVPVLLKEIQNLKAEILALKGS